MTKKKYVPTEAEFEARMNAVLRQIFPTFKEVGLKHQESLSLNFGHRNIIFSTKDIPKSGKTKGIYDILLTVGEKNAILFELKRENHIISKEDIEQGLSYGRLIHPMPPITVISNGSDTRLFNTYSFTKLPDDTAINVDLIESLIFHATRLAKHDLKDAVEVLLNNEPQVISKILNSISEKNFDKLVGEIMDFNKPIVKDFLIPRKITKELFQETNNNQIICLIGAIFSGKTNILYEIFKIYSGDNSAILYVDLHDTKYSLFEKLAISFSRELDFNVDSNKIKEWFRISIREMSELKIIFLFDNYDDTIHQSLNSDIYYLIDLIEGTRHSLIYSIDEINIYRITKKKYRNYKTILGAFSKFFTVRELNDSEYEILQDFFWKKFKMIIQHGGQITPEYREPRFIRIIGNLFMQKRSETSKNQYGTFASIPNLELLISVTDKVLHKTFRRRQRNLLMSFSEIYLSKKVKNASTEWANIATINAGALSSKLVKSKLDKSAFKLLKNSGLFVEKYISDQESLIIPKVPELISYYGIQSITQFLIEEQTKGRSIEKIINQLLLLCRYFSYSDIVGVGVLTELDKRKKYNLFSDIVSGLLNYSLETTPIAKDTIVGTFFEDVGFLKMKFDEDSSNEFGEFLSDNLPYLILSQLLQNRLGTNEDIESDNPSFDLHLSLLWKVGSYKGSLIRINPRYFRNKMLVGTYEINGIGTIVSGASGIVEPITQSIQHNFLFFPDEIERLYKEAITRKNFLLLWRIYLALRDFVNYPDSLLATKAKHFMEAFKPAFSEMMKEILVSNKDEQIQKEVNKMKNDFKEK